MSGGSGRTKTSGIDPFRFSCAAASRANSISRRLRRWRAVPSTRSFFAPRGFNGSPSSKSAETPTSGVYRFSAALRQGPFSPQELDRLAALSRRLAGAAELARAFGFARIEAALDAFEASHSPVAMIDRMGEVVRLNRSAERLLGPDLQIVRRRIVSWSRDATAALDRALHDLIWRRGAESLRPPVVLPRQSGRPIVAYPSRLSNAVREGFALVQGFVVFADLDARPAPLAADLIRVFGLTTAEARLADRLMREESLTPSPIVLASPIRLRATS